MAELNTRPPDENDPIIAITPAPLPGSELRAACEAWLRDRKWRRAKGTWWDEGNGRLSLGEALDVQWARDGKEASQ